MEDKMLEAMMRVLVTGGYDMNGTPMSNPMQIILNDWISSNREELVEEVAKLIDMDELAEKIAEVVFKSMTTKTTMYNRATPLISEKALQKVVIDKVAKHIAKKKIAQLKKDN